MHTNEIKFVVFVFFGGTLLSLIISGAWILNGEMNVFEAISSLSTVKIDSGGGWAAAKGVTAFFDGLITVFTWDYPYLQSPWAFPLRVVGWVISAGVVWGVIQASAGIAQGIVGSIRSLITPG